MVKIELDIEGISWYIETTLETDTVPAVGDIIIVDKDCISERDSAELWKNAVQSGIQMGGRRRRCARNGMVRLRKRKMLVNKRTWKYNIEEEENRVHTWCKNLFTMRIYSCDIRFYHPLGKTGYGNDTQKRKISGRQPAGKASAGCFHDREKRKASLLLSSPAGRLTERKVNGGKQPPSSINWF